MSEHRCHAHCGRACAPSKLMCRTCWAKVPEALQRDVNAAYLARAGTRDAAWLRAARAAINHVRGLDPTGKPLPPRMEDLARTNTARGWGGSDDR